MPHTASTQRAGTADGRTFTIRPAGGLPFPSFTDLWQYRDLLYFLTWRDIKVRYKQTAIGILWVLIQPVGMTLVFTVFFGMLANLDSDGLPYPVFAMAGLLPWQLFSRALTETSQSLVGNERLITRVYFPRLVIPLSVIIASLLDFVIAFGLLIVLMAVYGVAPTLTVLTLPLFLLLIVATTLGVSLWLSALNVEFRDVRYAVPFLTQFWLFVTPVAYASSLVPDRWQVVYGLNPMAGAVRGFRWALLGVESSLGPMMIVSVVVAVVLLVTGAMYFKWREHALADVLGSGGR